MSRACRARRAAARAAASLLAGCLLAGCTFGLSHHAPQAHRPGRFHGFVGHAIFIGGAGAVAIIGGGGGSGSRPKITVPSIPPADSSVAVQLPLEAYQAVSTQQQETLAQASNLLTQRCMAQRGFDDTNAAGEPFTSVTSLQQIETGAAGLTSPAQAATFGFAQPKGAGTQAGQSGPAIIGFAGGFAFNSSLKTGRAFTEALYGFTPGAGGGPGRVSCFQLASRLVYGPRAGEPVSDPVPQIAAQAVTFTQSDPRIGAANQAWSACMASRHYHYATPSQVERHHWPSPPTKKEIATAVADVTCKAQVNYLNTWLAVEAAYQQALIGRNLAALSQLQASFAPLLRRAEAALTAPTLPGA